MDLRRIFRKVPKALDAGGGDDASPLGDAIADLERYRGGHIVVTDASLRALPVTAAFDARQADAALDTMALALPIRVRRLTDFLVVLSPRA